MCFLKSLEALCQITSPLGRWENREIGNPFFWKKVLKVGFMENKMSAWMITTKHVKTENQSKSYDFPRPCEIFLTVDRQFKTNFPADRHSEVVQTARV